jgi:hypothetical protein
MTGNFMICLHVAIGLIKSKIFVNSRKLTMSGEIKRGFVLKKSWKETT